MASEGYCGWQSETASWRTEAGHFVNLVHTGIECGTVQAIAEDFELLEVSPYVESLNSGHSPALDIPLPAAP